MDHIEDDLKIILSNDFFGLLKEQDDDYPFLDELYDFIQGKLQKGVHMKYISKETGPFCSGNEQITVTLVYSLLPRKHAKGSDGSDGTA
jgi:hypothetical protein